MGRDALDEKGLGRDKGAVLTQSRPAPTHSRPHRLFAFAFSGINTGRNLREEAGRKSE